MYFATLTLGATKRTLKAQGHTYDLLNFNSHQLSDVAAMLCETVDIRGDMRPVKERHHAKRRHNTRRNPSKPNKHIVKH